MRPMDYERVEAQLMGGLAAAGGARGLGHHHGWSTTNMGENFNISKWQKPKFIEYFIEDNMICIAPS